jgi:hypothetical protein
METKEIFKCEFCDRELKTKSGLIMHQRSCKKRPDSIVEEVDAYIKDVDAEELTFPDAPNIFENPTPPESDPEVDVDIIEKEEVIIEPIIEEEEIIIEEPTIDEEEEIIIEPIIEEEEEIIIEEPKSGFIVFPDHYEQLQRLVNRYKMSGRTKVEDIPLIAKLYKKFTGKEPGNLDCGNTVSFLTLCVARNFNDGKFE